MKVTIFSILALFLITGCSTKSIFAKKPVKIVNKSKKITMKTKKFAFSDTGFYKSNDKLIQIQAYSTGVAVANMKFYKNSDSVCVGYKCTNRKYFNDNFLSKYYPNKLIVNILSAKPIMGAENLTKSADGFTQNIKTAEYDITYRVTSNSIYFKDRLNRILIKLKDL